MVGRICDHPWRQGVHKGIEAVFPDVPEKPDIVRALIGSGFTITNVLPQPNYHQFCVARTELLGSKVHYIIVVACRRLSASEVDWLCREAKRDGAVLILVGETETTPQDVSVLTYSQFFDRLGGPIFSLLPFDPEYKQRLLILGDNRVPIGLKGTADDLFEQYVHAGLQFLFRSRVIRYGQDRRGEPVPDGVTIGRSIPLMLYDAKAAGGGYNTSLESVRQFADYVDEFHKAYESVIGRVAYFLVISGSFDDTEDTLEGRSRAVQARCGVPLSFLTVGTFGSIVESLVKEPLCRPTLDWHLIFARPVVHFKDVEEQLRMRIKDNLLVLSKG
jgi:hypothetical protein